MLSGIILSGTANIGLLLTKMCGCQLRLSMYITLLYHNVNMITTSDERTEGVDIYDELGTVFMYGQLLHWFSVSSY